MLKGIEEARGIIDSEEDAEIRELGQRNWPNWSLKRNGWRKSCLFFCFPRIPMMRRMLLWKSGQEPVVMKLASLLQIFRMYTRYAESKGWKSEIMSSNQSELGGFKEVIFSLEGEDVYSRMKYESGVHRVQRVPVTESGGRIHTSTATVAVLPEAEEVELEIDPNDLPDRCFPFQRAWQAECKYHRLCCADYPPADRYSCLLSGREIPT